MRGKVKDLSAILADAMKEHMSFAHELFTTDDKNMHLSARQYWKTYGTACIYQLRSVGLKNDDSVENGKENSTSHSNTVQKTSENKINIRRSTFDAY